MFKINNHTLGCFLHEDLTQLKLSGLLTDIGDEALLQVAKKCPELTELSLYNCNLFSPYSGIQLFQQLKHLEFLNLSKSVIASPEVIKAVAQYCPNLTS